MIVESKTTSSPHGSPGHTCLTGCAGTFKRAMQGRRLSKASIQLNSITEQKGDDEDSCVTDDNESAKEIFERKTRGRSASRRASVDCTRRPSNSSSGRSSTSPSHEIMHLRGIKNRKMSLDSGKLPALGGAFNLSDIKSKLDFQQVENKDDVGRNYNMDRRRSSLARILSPQGPDLIEGRYNLVGSDNFEKYLEAIGTGRFSRDMVMGSKMKLDISRTPDKQWQFINETSIKAKSVTGYSTYSRKLTFNKFKEEEAKPELMEDWDPRMLVTTLYRENDGATLKLVQVAEKDQKHNADSTVIFSIDRDDAELLIMTCTLGDLTARRKFIREEAKKPTGMGRRHSIV